MAAGERIFEAGEEVNDTAAIADQNVDEAARNMAEIQIRRLPVFNRDKRLVGIVSLGDTATMAGATETGEALSGISIPGGQHS